MKKGTKIIYKLFSVFYIVLIAACDSEQDSWNIPEVNKHTGISFPAATIILSATDGGGKERDVKYDAYTWTLFSPVSVNMPSMIKHDGDPPLEDTVKYIENSMYKKKTKISNPQYAFYSNWETNGYCFYATVVRSQQGDYMVINRVRKQ
ncbi:MULTISPECIES: hypothetical protein [unclassified Akkermansia]|jgi:hypothetical protein|uniref:hypothetical protein n=1 Tax=unclassified Akkermansia TaxID=2608915 RepID=UPI00079284B7|nr:MULTISPECIES: hypothetical protein [unclassified Akkermansia]KXT48787.1 hypothetical protein HMPREF3038_02487 [Akkermansia sp. KLE1797]KXU54779.1 hypothetical protein HMPREF3039_00926 [Akkermansia sp. KLE1798]KZA06168.1 hypothetical protein HMPREF1326_00016 [Akkermansia sp. KLE1605]